MLRRQFLIGMAGAAAGLILPDWLIKAERFVEEEGEPLLEEPRRTSTILTAEDMGGDALQLFVGNPYQDPPEWTWREYLDHAGFGSLEEYFGEEDHGLTLDDWVDEETVIDAWVRDGSPSSEAFDLLDSLDLGPEFDGRNGKEHIRFYDGVCPGNDSRVVEVPDNLSLSLLQKRLNDLDTGIKVVEAKPMPWPGKQMPMSGRF